jgi:hypothetical protein
MCRQVADLLHGLRERLQKWAAGASVLQVLSVSSRMPSMKCAGKAGGSQARARGIAVPAEVVYCAAQTLRNAARHVAGKFQVCCA